uniref:Putative secreted protein n=1 Tax=Anopheles marajoara TaxID=58244 RepID=A0A2M4CC34_9DIPT
MRIMHCVLIRGSRSLGASALFASAVYWCRANDVSDVTGLPVVACPRRMPTNMLLCCNRMLRPTMQPPERQQHNSRCLTC